MLPEWALKTTTQLWKQVSVPGCGTDWKVQQCGGGCQRGGFRQMGKKSQRLRDRNELIEITVMEVRQCSKLSYTIDAVTQLPAPGAQATRVPTATKGWLGEETFARAEQVRLWHLRSMQPDPFDSRKSCGCQGHLCSLSSQPTVNTVCLYVPLNGAKEQTAAASVWRIQAILRAEWP